MKKIEAIIRTSKFELVKESLQSAGFNFFTFYEVKGFGHQKGKNISYRGAVYDVGYIGRVKLEILVSDSFVETALKCIKESAYTGEKGDGLVIMSSIDEIINIRTGLHNSESINF